jgi:drug/metabolite transporter (DMT)-like permease
VRSPSARRGYLIGLAAAVSFGISAPLAKRFLNDVEPQMLAGLLYIGAFVALAALGRRSEREARIGRSDLPRLASMVVAGGVVAPVLLLLGLERVSGITGSLLLNLEGVFTITIGVAVFHEHLPTRSWLAAAAIFAGAVVLGLGPGGATGDWIGLLLIAAACVGWGIDNNLTQSLTVRDPLSIVRIKAGVAGATNVLIAFALGESLPGGTVLLGVLALGGVAYGVSVYLDALALRALGAAREAAVFAVAPFAGALLAPFVLPESFGIQEVAAGALMAVGVAVLVGERHDHEHAHELLEHEHVHVHDEHHQHEHALGTALGEPHSHPHRHEPLTHRHPHVSDVHHRHSH